MTVHGVADVTIAGGKVVWEDGELHTENGWGRILQRSPFGYAYRDQPARDKCRDPSKYKVEREPYTGDVVDVDKRAPIPGRNMNQ